MKSSWRIPLRIVFYRDDGAWVAHCLEFDLCGDGATREDAIQNLVEAMRIQLEVSLENDNPANLFSPADAKYHQMYFAGRDVAACELAIARIHRENISIEDVHCREYDSGELPGRDLMAC